MNLFCSVQGVVGAASGAGIAIGTYFAFYGAASNTLARTTNMKPGRLLTILHCTGTRGVPYLASCIKDINSNNTRSGLEAPL